MSLSIALHTAMTGLNAANRTAQVVSSNIANALTPGYARRQIDLVPGVFNGQGQGVGIDGVSRKVSPAMLAERRLADAELTNRSQSFAALDRIDAIFGGTDAGSLFDRYSRFEDALIQAAARPDSETGLRTVVDRARSLAQGLNNAGENVQQERAAADAAIAKEVDALNAGLARIDELNTRIFATKSGSDSRASLEDQRRLEIDRISEIVSVRLYQRDNGRIAIATTEGRLLLDATPVKIGFTQATAVDAGATISGTLSGLNVNGDPSATPPGGGFGGGRLAALFKARDQYLPAAQEQLDAIARDLITRLSGSDADSSLAAGDAGLFTDAGGPFVAAAETGLAQRLDINPAVDPGQGGGLWRLRDGVNATASGPVGNPDGLNRLLDVLGDPRSPASGNFGMAKHTMSGLFGVAAADAHGAALTAENDLAYATARSETLQNEEQAMGVDTDAEMQTLLLVEQAYAANARVLQVADEMAQSILEI